MQRHPTHVRSRKKAGRVGKYFKEWNQKGNVKKSRKSLKKWETKESGEVGNLWLKYGSYKLIELFVNGCRKKRKTFVRTKVCEVLVALDECLPVTHNTTSHNLDYVYDMMWAIWINDGVELWGHDQLCKTLSVLPRCIDTGSVEMDLSTQSRKRNVMLLTAKYRQWFQNKNTDCLVKWG